LGIVDWRPRFTFSRRHFIELFSFGIKALATDVLIVISGYADRLLMGYFLGATDVALLSLATRVREQDQHQRGRKVYALHAPGTRARHVQ
jgi:hypothetical protein